MKTLLPANPHPAPPAARRADAEARFEQECMDFFAEMVQVFGVPKSVGQIYGLLYASPEPLSFSDIVDRLDISKGSASQGLQLLRTLGAINIAETKRKAQSGKQVVSPLAPGAPVVSAVESSRREYFEPELGLRKLVSGVLQERVSPLATAGAERLSRLRGLAEQGGEGRDFLLDRVKQLETWRRRLKAVLPVLNMLLGPKRRD